MLVNKEEALTADVLLVIWAALQARPESPTGGGKERGFQDEVEVTIPWKGKAPYINKYLELAFGNTFEPLPEAAQGKHTIVCARKTADAIRSGITIRDEEVKAHSKKRKMERDDSDTGDEEGTRTVKKDKDMGQTKGDDKPWFSGCYGCGEDHRWSACQAVGPLGQRKRCTRCDKIRHIAKVCADAAPARAAYIKKYGKPWEFEQNLPDPERNRRGSRSCSPKNKRSRDRDGGYRARSRDKDKRRRSRSRDTRGRDRRDRREKSRDRSRGRSREYGRGRSQEKSNKREDPDRKRKRSRSHDISRSRDRRPAKVDVMDARGGDGRAPPLQWPDVAPRAPMEWQRPPAGDMRWASPARPHLHPQHPGEPHPQWSPVGGVHPPPVPLTWSRDGRSSPGWSRRGTKTWRKGWRVRE